MFVTGYTDYILEGYEVEALNYLLKPVTEEKLIGVLNRATERLRRNERALVVEFGGETVRVPFGEIRYIEVMRNYVTIHTHEDYTVKKTLGEIEAELDEGFLRVGRSFVVGSNLSGGYPGTRRSPRAARPFPSPGVPMRN